MTRMIFAVLPSVFAYSSAHAGGGGLLRGSLVRGGLDGRR